MEDKNTVGQADRLYFPFYRSFYTSIDKLPAKMQLPLYRAIALYSLDFQEPDFSKEDDIDIIQAIWGLLLPTLRKNNQQFLNGKRNPGEAGNQNARKRAKNEPKTSRKRAETDKEERNKEERNMEYTESLVFPFHSPKFFDTWNELCRQPKWRKKTLSALQKSLDKLSAFPEAFALELMETAIANDTQGVVYPSTPDAFKEWEREHLASQGAGATSGHQRPRNPRIDIDRNTPEDTSTI